MAARPDRRSPGGWTGRDRRRPAHERGRL